MLVPDWLVPVPMRMRLAQWIVRPVLMMMVVVVTMPVLVFHGLVNVRMLMPFGQMQPETESHQHPGDSKLSSEALAQG